MMCTYTWWLASSAPEFSSLEDRELVRRRGQELARALVPYDALEREHLRLVPRRQWLGEGARGIRGTVSTTSMYNCSRNYMYTT